MGRVSPRKPPALAVGSSHGVNGCIAYLWAIGMIVTVTLSGPMI